jgi:hypothetical protein
VPRIGLWFRACAFVLAGLPNSAVHSTEVGEVFNLGGWQAPSGCRQPPIVTPAVSHVIVSY